MIRTVGRVLLNSATGSKLAQMATLLMASAVSMPAFADRPKDWQMVLQDPATPVADRVAGLHNHILVPLIVIITLFVLALLLYVSFRFRASAHPVPSRTSHNTVIEILWTVLPVLILVVIAIPSFNLLYFQEEIPKADMTLKVKGVQWYWHYDYPDNGNFGFDSNVVDEKDLKDKSLRLLEVDNEVVLPVGATVRVLIAGNDVMHSWFVPSLGAQKYAVPGHLNELWIKIERPGTYYGECNQICGVNHAFMPIKVRAVSPDEFNQWVGQAKTKFAATDALPSAVTGRPLTKLASAQ